MDVFILIFYPDSVNLDLYSKFSYFRFFYPDSVNLDLYSKLSYFRFFISVKFLPIFNGTSITKKNPD